MVGWFIDTAIAASDPATGPVAVLAGVDAGCDGAGADVVSGARRFRKVDGANSLFFVLWCATYHCSK
jgi:hypothetical protein